MYIRVYDVCCLKSEDRYYAGRAGDSRMLEVGNTESSKFNDSRVEILAELKRKICERKKSRLSCQVLYRQASPLML